MIVFDLDDTLYLEKQFVASGRAAVAEYYQNKIGVESSILLEVMNNPGNPFDNLTEKYFRHLDESQKESEIRRMIEIYRNHTPQISLLPEAKLLLDYLKSRNQKIGIISDGFKTTQFAKISALGLMEYVDRQNIIISEEIHADKHTPLPFKIIMQRNGDESNWVYIADNPAKDFFYADELGFFTIMINDVNGRFVHSQCPDTNLPHYKEAQHTVNSLIEIPKIISNIL